MDRVNEVLACKVGPTPHSPHPHLETFQGVWGLGRVEENSWGRVYHQLKVLSEVDYAIQSPNRSFFEVLTEIYYATRKF